MSAWRLSSGTTPRERRRRDFGKRGVVVISLWAAATVADQREVRACSCVPEAPLFVAFADADFVFLGVVIDHESYTLELPATGAEFDAEAGWHVITLRVIESWKGITGTETSVVGSLVCGIAPRVGTSVLIYGYASDQPGTRFDGYPFASGCSRTRSGEFACAERARLHLLGYSSIPLAEGPDAAYPPLELIDSAGAMDGETEPSTECEDDFAALDGDLCGEGILGALFFATFTASACGHCRLTRRDRLRRGMRAAALAGSLCPRLLNDSPSG